MTFDLESMLQDLGITRSVIEACPMKICEECTDLVEAGPDLLGRPQKMTRETLEAWLAMKAAARADGLDLQIVSAHRSIEYQCELIRRKLDAGRTIEDILQVNAIPGYSEHHTGRAIDVHAGDGEPLELTFELHPAFNWLCDNAARFNFHMSYPRNNPEGIDYEPWHWCYR